MNAVVRTTIAIIADDFTGANDTGVQFSKKGLRTGVSLDSGQLQSTLSRFSAVAVDTESRFDGAERAYDKVYAAVTALAAAGVTRFYKKVDSTMRGNIGSEIAATLDAAALSLAVVAPALPAHGRTTVNGLCLVDGTPVAETEFGRDPRTPVRDSRIETIIASQCDFALDSVPLSTVRRGPRALFETIGERPMERRIVVLDAETDQDLDIIGQSIALFDRAGRVPLIIGSSGLAERLPSSIFSRRHNSPSPGRPTLIVVGSVSETAHRQMEHARAARPDLRELVLNPDAVLRDPRVERERLIKLFSAAFTNGSPSLLRSTRPHPDGDTARDPRGAAVSRTAERLAQFIGDLVAEICRRYPPGAIMLSGGDTAIRTAASLGCAGFSIRAEVLPGIPCGNFIFDGEKREPASAPSAAIEASLATVPIVTKAGGFGKPDAIVQILHYLEEHSI